MNRDLAEVLEPRRAAPVGPLGIAEGVGRCAAFAEEEGFEPPSLFRLPGYQPGAIDHSTTPVRLAFAGLKAMVEAESVVPDRRHVKCRSPPNALRFSSDNRERDCRLSASAS